MTLRVKQEPIFILHRKKFRETSFLVDIFSEQYGKIKAITRLNTKSKKGLIQPFTPCYASWTIKTELATLQEIESRGLAPTLTGEKLLCCFYLNEIIMKTTTFGDPCPKIFKAYSNALATIVTSKNIAIPLRIFEKYLLEELGYGIPLEEAILNEEKFPFYNFSHQYGLQGSFIEHPNSISYKTIASLYKDNIESEQELKESKYLLQYALQPIIKKFDIKSRLCWSTPNKAEELCH
jgi:DNA repair protein RecO (recombination protein O)